MKVFWALLVLAFASFSVYWLAVENPTPKPVAGGTILEKAGLAWVDGNSSAVFLVVNSTQPVNVTIEVFDRELAERVLVWNDSDQASFEAFSYGLRQPLSDLSFSVSIASPRNLVLDRKGVLVVASSAMPSELFEQNRLLQMLESGWVVVYSGLSFSEMRSQERIVPNPLWPYLKQRLGISAERLDSAWAKGVSVGRGLPRDGGWEVVRVGSGFLVVWRGVLDTSFSDSQKAVEAFVDFIGNYRWLRPIVSSLSNVSGTTMVYSSSFSEIAPTAVVWLDDGKKVERRVAVLQKPSLRIIHPQALPINRSFSLSILSNLSSNSVLDLNIVNATQVVFRRPLGSFPTGVSWHSYSLEAGLPAGNYFLTVSDSRGVLGNSVLRVFSYNAKVQRADANSKTVYARLFEGSRPAALRELTWLNRTVSTDGEGFFRLSGALVFEGLNHWPVTVDSQSVPIEYFAQSGFLSSWTDRLLLAAALGLFGVAVFFRRAVASEIRLVDAGPTRVKRVRVTAQQLASVIESVSVREGPQHLPVSVREFSDGACRFLLGPLHVVSVESASSFLTTAQAAGLAYFQDGLAGLRSWYRTENEAREAFFWRRISDGLTLSGWTFKRAGRRINCRKASRKMVLCAVPEDGCCRIVGSKKALPLDKLLERLSFED